MLNKVGCNFDNIQFVAAPPLRHEPRCEELDGEVHAIFLLEAAPHETHFFYLHQTNSDRGIFSKLLSFGDDSESE